jgi:hypothetical protein
MNSFFRLEPAVGVRVVLVEEQPHGLARHLLDHGLLVSFGQFAVVGDLSDPIQLLNVPISKGKEQRNN